MRVGRTSAVRALGHFNSPAVCCCPPFFILQRGNLFADTSTRARATIAELGARFIRPGSVILVHGHSRVVLALLQKAIASVSATTG